MLKTQNIKENIAKPLNKFTYKLKKVKLNVPKSDLHGSIKTCGI